MRRIYIIHTQLSTDPLFIGAYPHTTSLLFTVIHTRSQPSEEFIILTSTVGHIHTNIYWDLQSEAAAFTTFVVSIFSYRKDYDVI